MTHNKTKEKQADDIMLIPYGKYGCQKETIQKCRVGIGNVNSRQVHNFKYLRCDFTNAEICGTETRTVVRLGKDHIKKINKVLRNRTIS